MQGENFTKISAHYDKTSVIQLSASELLIKLLSPKPGEKILDAGCGTGKITARLAGIAGAGNVKGIDASEGMIATARKNNPDIDFDVVNAADIAYDSEFDIIFCNSTFQWFREPEKELRRFYAALKPGGRVGIQSPATKDYCRGFIDAVDYAAASDPIVSGKYKSFRAPWNFLDTAVEYAALFERCGFTVEHATIEEIPTTYTADQAYEVFSSGAAAGYLGAEYYGHPIDEDYIERFKRLVAEFYRKNADDKGNFTLVFKRIYLTAVK